MSRKKAICLFATLSLAIISWCGCGPSPSANTARPALKGDFHKPDSFNAAVKRIREIHDHLVSDEALRKPVSFTVKEVSHSHGPGDSHVHYHLVENGEVLNADCDCEDHDHEDHSHGDDDHHADGHVHADSVDQPTIHNVTVDIFTELHDIVRWLPMIASDGDLPRDSWNKAKQISEEMTAGLEPVIQAELPLIQRSSYQSASQEMQQWVVGLESLVEPESVD